MYINVYSPYVGQKCIDPKLKTHLLHYSRFEVGVSEICNLKYGKKTQNFTENIFDNLILAITHFDVHPVPLYHSFEKKLCRFTIFLQLIN